MKVLFSSVLLLKIGDLSVPSTAIVYHSLHTHLFENGNHPKQGHTTGIITLANDCWIFNTS